ncbi:NADH dehydrogenase [Mycobacterium antarcticum]|uniref:NADH-ubiquinone oxidoreductase-F iron-sulfur binding region domain-containing protein n=1 Tax=unclassified Mycolicibacterium TaxID=2636767 RepID=UPI00239240CD|nr:MULTISPECIES: NADH-ubiquinone oxidoreductase-F iron-sulfur binding region domain-containing protein [unclassified Mycolicibacterium]BDX31120.1 NADH dehydrogenase [Mycolicibacterium sp. TUM20985]GLP74472.1 NADH dehydrogenase [Mycolicibacterium sp. TUM20983]GLP80267.1 NADH dehydrogenase [Mycolicibacterium sp. TUM20984]
MTAPNGLAAELTIAAWPGMRPRLLRLEETTEDHATYVRAGGYQDVDDPDALLDEVDLGGLLGRGGAAFPMAVKLRAVREAGRSGRDTVVVANGEEGEPASIKDKWLLRNRPHLVLDGVRLAARMVAAARAVVYVSDTSAAQAMTDAIAEAGDALPPIDVVSVRPGYVAGEETAAVRAINGGPAKPTDKPPRPFECGVDGNPTLVSNVETLANLPFLLRHGADAYRSEGTSASPGTFLATVTGAGHPAALYELPHGVPFTDLLELHGVSPDHVNGVLMGGYFAGLLNRTVLTATLDHETMRGLGSGLGCGAVALITDNCPVAVAALVMAYFDRENAGQCGSCFNGTAAMSAVTRALCQGVATAEDVTRLERWSVQLRGRGACATLDAATNVAASLLLQFPEAVAHHLDGVCDACQIDQNSVLRPYEVEAVW